jgi:hypothetical protein
MKKKIRKIVVNGNEYFWNCLEYDDEGYPDRYIKIWKDKKLIHNQRTTETSVTPKLIKTIISNI